MRNFSLLTLNDLRALAAADVTHQSSTTEWIWHGYVARSNTTIFTGIWKGGKTTLLALLLARRARGGELAGRAVHPGKTLVITEENPAHWNQRIHRLNIEGAWFLPRPFNSIPTSDQWHSLIDFVLKFRADNGIDLLMLDPLAGFLPCENNSKLVFDSLLPLSELNRQGVGVLLTHHPAKAERSLGNSARGSGAILSHAAITIEMRRPGLDPRTRCRRLIAFSRHDETPRQLFVEPPMPRTTSCSRTNSTTAWKRTGTSFSPSSTRRPIPSPVTKSTPTGPPTCGAPPSSPSTAGCRTRWPATLSPATAPAAEPTPSATPSSRKTSMTWREQNTNVPSIGGPG